MAMTKAQAAAAIRAHVAENYLYMRPGVRVADTDSLLATGVIDSMGVMELIAFVQETLGVQIADDDVTEQNLGTIDGLASYVATHGAAATDAIGLGHAGAQPTSRSATTGSAIREA